MGGRLTFRLTIVFTDSCNDVEAMSEIVSVASIASAFSVEEISVALCSVIDSPHCSEGGTVAASVNLST